MVIEPPTTTAPGKASGAYTCSVYHNQVIAMKFESWRCQRCGEEIGYMGRFAELTCWPLLLICKSVFHNCPELFSRSSEQIPKGKSNDRANGFPILNRLDGACDKQNKNSGADKHEY